MSPREQQQYIKRNAMKEPEGFIAMVTGLTVDQVKLSIANSRLHMMMIAGNRNTKMGLRSSR